MLMQKYAFVDRDGTFVDEPDIPVGADPREAFPLKSPDELHFMDGAISSFKILLAKGYKLVMVTNQSFLGSPSHPWEIFNAVQKRIFDTLAKEGIAFDFVMVCPHGPDDGCDCRKPKIGGMKEFLEKNKGNIDFPNSLMFGDRDTDREFAENLGVRFVPVERNKTFVLPKGI